MKPKKVAILAYPKLCTFEFGCAVELFALPRPDIDNWYQCDIIAIQSEAIEATGGFQMKSDIIFSSEQGFSSYDMVVIAGWTSTDTSVSKPLITALKCFYQQGGTLVSFCSGAFVVASTGLLDNKDATTHWRYEKTFKQMFPSIHFKENVLYTHSDRLYTSAGSASALDLGISIIRKDFGVSIANMIAKRLVIYPQREGGQAQFSENTQTIDSGHLNGSLKWAKDNLHDSISIDQMAEHANLSRRSFDRHFRTTIGSSPKEWLTKQRIYLAKAFLESSRASVEQIAEKSGFGSTMNFRHHFSKVLGISPSHYRNQFISNTKKPN